MSGKENGAPQQVMRIFAAIATAEHANAAKKERFHRITPEYILVYGEHAPGNGCEWPVVEGNNLKRLTEEDETWLFGCCVVFYTELLKERSGNVRENLSVLIDKLEQELESERKDTGGDGA